MNNDKRIALTIIGGFLGAGKSTLLNRILHTTQRRTMVLINDFGSINVDAALVKNRSGDTINLTNGCVCCSLGGGLYDALASAIERTPTPEWIVIEASGVSDPARIAQVGMSDPMLELESVLVVVDTSALLEQLADPLLADTITRQLDGAAILLLSKTDLAGEQQTAAVKQWLEQHLPAIPILPIDCDISQLQIAAPPAAGASHNANNAPPLPHDEHHPFTSWFWQTDQVVNADKLTAALKQLPRYVVRAKGWITTDRHGKVLLQFASGRVKYSHTTPAEKIASGLVVIAAGQCDSQKINQHLDCAISEQKQPVH